MQFSLECIARTVEGKLSGSKGLLLTGISLIDKARPDEITFAGNKSDFHKLESYGFCRAGAAIVPLGYKGTYRNVVRVDNVQLAIAKTIALFNPKEKIRPGISSRSDIHGSASLGKDVSIGPHSSIGARSIVGDRTAIESGVCIGDDVVIGNDTTISHRAVILPHTFIGNRVTVQPGTLIGVDSFGYVKDGIEWVKTPSAGSVVIEDDVCLGAYSTIERANLGKTRICRGVKTGNLVYIGHNVHIGCHTIVQGYAGIAGNTYVGNNVLIGSMAGIADELSIGHEAVIGPKASIVDDVPYGGSAYGTPGMSRTAWLRSASLIPELSTMRKKITRMARRIDELESGLHGKATSLS